MLVNGPTSRCTNDSLQFSRKSLAEIGGCHWKSPLSKKKTEERTAQNRPQRKQSNAHIESSKESPDGRVLHRNYFQTHRDTILDDKLPRFGFATKTTSWRKERKHLTQTLGQSFTEECKSTKTTEARIDTAKSRIIRASKILSNWANFELSRQNSIVEIDM